MTGQAETETPHRKSLRLEVDPELKEAMRDAAKRRRKTLAGWMRDVIVERLEDDDEY